MAHQSFGGKRMVDGQWLLENVSILPSVCYRFIGVINLEGILGSPFPCVELKKLLAITLQLIKILKL